MTQVKYASRTYLLEFGVVMTLYVVTILARSWLAGLSSDANVRFAAIALPIIPIWLTLIVVVRHYLRIDERERLRSSWKTCRSPPASWRASSLPIPCWRMQVFRSSPSPGRGRHSPPAGDSPPESRRCASDEKHPAPASRGTWDDAGRSCGEAQRFAPDRHCHRDRAVRSQPAARLRHREAVCETCGEDIFFG